MKLVFSLFLALCVLTLGANATRMTVTGLPRLLIKDEIMELQFFYNRNMDATTSLLANPAISTSDPVFLERVNNVVGVFCPDPIFQGWTATGGLNGGIQNYAPHRDAADPTSVPPGQSVRSIYRDILPFWFGNSSQHMVGMPIVTVYYDDAGNLLAELNATLRQTVNINIDPTGPVPPVDRSAHNPINIEIQGQYFNTYLWYNPPGNGDHDAYWCMQKFNAFNSFSWILPTSIYGGQNAVNGQLSAFVRPNARNPLA